MFAFSLLLVHILFFDVQLYAAPSGTDSPASESALPSIYTYTIVNTYLHDPNAFTQGLVFEDGFFYEGTGHYGAFNYSQSYACHRRGFGAEKCCT